MAARRSPLPLASRRFQEWITPELAIKSALKSLTFDSKSEFQRVQVVETAPFGKTLVLDGKTQSAKNDEHIYHESLVHPAMLQHPDPKTVRARGVAPVRAPADRVLTRPRSTSAAAASWPPRARCSSTTLSRSASWSTLTRRSVPGRAGAGRAMRCAASVRRTDSLAPPAPSGARAQVVDICKEQLPEWNAGSTEDPRLELHFDDAKKFLEEDDRKYDVIIMDIADPIEAGPGIVLYTGAARGERACSLPRPKHSPMTAPHAEEFYKFAATKLNPGGVLVTQSGPGSHFNITECFTAINQTLRRAFNCVVPLSADIPSFGSNWGFNIAFNAEGDAAEASEALVERRAKDTDALVAKRLSRPLRYYDGITHRGLFGVPKEVREKIEAEERVMTIANPVFMF